MRLKNRTAHPSAVCYILICHPSKKRHPSEVIFNLCPSFAVIYLDYLSVAFPEDVVLYGNSITDLDHMYNINNPFTFKELLGEFIVVSLQITHLR